MASHSNETEAHDFYYKGVDQGIAKAYSGCSLSYDGDKAISYSTVVAKVIPAKGFKKEQINTHNDDSGITLVSFFPMTSTTGRHISSLRRASPFETVDVPMDMGARDIYPDELADKFYKQLSYYATVLNKRENRSTFIWLMQSRRALLDRADERWAKPLRNKRFDKFDKIDTEKEAKAIQEKNRQAAVKRAAETKAILKKYVGDKRGADYIEFVRVLFDNWYHSEKYPMDDHVRSILKSKFAKAEAAYVWIKDDNIVTSRGARVSIDDAKLAMIAWARGTDMRKFNVGPYQIVKYEGNEIKIGCHIIPRENMIALYEAVIGKPFPKKLEKQEAA